MPKQGRSKHSKRFCKTGLNEHKLAYRKMRIQTKKVIAKAMQMKTKKEMEELREKPNKIFKFVKLMKRDGNRGAGTSDGQGRAGFSKGTFNTVRAAITTNIAL